MQMVFDIGLHQGFDAEFYLRKGFKVIGLEAVPALCQKARRRLAKFEGRGDLVIVNRALAPRDVKETRFYVNRRKSDWGNTNRHTAEKGLDIADEMVVPATTLSDLFDAYGVPHYLKSDIEGADPLLIEQLREDGRRPTFMSVETHSAADIRNLACCGYDRFQLVNQWMHAFVVCPNPSREGTFVQGSFNGETSGLFGKDLPQDKWLDVESACRRFTMWRELNGLDENLAPGWIDTHACLSDRIPLQDQQ